MPSVTWGTIACVAVVGLGFVGCADDGSGQEGGGAKAGTPTWHQDIAPLVSEKCGACHREGGIAPFAMGDYESTKGWASAMAGAVEAGRMPPFLAQETDACQPRLPWYDDLRLSHEQKALLRAWADADAPEGDSATAAPRHDAEPMELAHKDLSLRIPQAIEVQGARDIHTCVVIDPGLDHDVYVAGTQLLPGNTKVLHHTVSYRVTPGADAEGKPRTKQQLVELVHKQTKARVGERYDCFGGIGLEGVGVDILDAWAPGGVPNLSPENAGQRLGQDALIIFDMHYHPTGETEVDDSTELALMFATERPAFINSTVLLGNVEGHLEQRGVKGDLLAQDDESEPSFFIPAGAKTHVEEMTISLTNLPPEGLPLYGAATHMHYVGRDMRVTLEHPQPEESQPDSECLIETPAWDFNWQRGYGYDARELTELPRLRATDVLHLRCVYDNTMENPFVVRALADRGLSEPIDVKLGEDTLDEMCVAGVAVLIPNPFP